MLNNQFTLVFTTENTTNMPSKGNSPFKPMKDIKIGEKALNRLNPSKATGPDKVPVRILKETANIITPILTNIYQVDQHRPNTRGLEKCQHSSNI
jgi:hypothetical protein